MYIRQKQNFENFHESKTFCMLRQKKVKLRTKENDLAFKVMLNCEDLGKLYIFVFLIIGSFQNLNRYSKNTIGYF